MKVLFFGALLSLALIPLISDGFASDTMVPEEPTSQESCSDASLLVAQAEGMAPPSGESSSSDIQERAVPRMPPGMMPMAPRQDFEGAFFENNRLRAKPGFVFEYLPGNRVVAKRAGGSGGTWDVKCNACTKKGKCEMIRTPDSVHCLGECTGSCNITISPMGTKLLIQ